MMERRHDKHIGAANKHIHSTVHFTQLCEKLSVPEDQLLEIIQFSIIEPLDSKASEWQFDESVTATAARAIRLHRDLEVDWAGVALALELIDELAQLRSENLQLRQRLARFEET